ncbi:MAG TPA: hypothetical protein VMF90_15820 [Rhizobiaceae bacterium]|nr:hypothetical protein [Rhizobiaceae bacterium]
MRLLLALLLLATAPAFACDGGRLFEMMAAQLPAEPTLSVDVADVQSVEGGVWDIYRAAGGAIANLVRTDFGEGGRLETRLVVSSPAAYAVTVTQFIYSAPLHISGSITIREEKDIYVFCDGKVLLPDPAELDPDSAYAAKAFRALATFDAAEIKTQVPALER